MLDSQFAARNHCRACNYLCAGMTYLNDEALVRKGKIISSIDQAFTYGIDEPEITNWKWGAHKNV
jgi:phosphoketolase